MRQKDGFHLKILFAASLDFIYTFEVMLTIEIESKSLICFGISIEMGSKYSMITILAYVYLVVK